MHALDKKYPKEPGDKYKQLFADWLELYAVPAWFGRTRLSTLIKSKGDDGLALALVLTLCSDTNHYATAAQVRTFQDNKKPLVHILLYPVQFSYSN